MKKITLTLLALICFLSAFSQHPQGLDSFMLQTVGSAKTLVKSKGAIGSDSGLVNSVYPDTASANFGKIKNYPGAVIRTGDSLWMRNYNATEWLLFSFGSSAYTVDNGLTASTLTNFQLGGTLIQNTQLHNDAYSLTIDQDVGSTVDPLQVFANNNNAIVGNSVDQTGVIGSSTNGYGVQANSSAVGIKATAPIAGQFQLPANDLVTEDPVIQLYRLANVAANGQGLSIQYLGSTSTGNVESLGSITAKWTDVTQATRTSMMEFYGTNSAVTARKMAIAGNGQLILDNYGVGAFTGTRTYNLGVDVSGNVIEVDTTAIVSETDPIALAKTITLTAGAGVSIAETATQALSLNPSWTITSNILTSQLTWSVLDILNTPPGSPADGDIYLVGTAGTGAWSGHNNEIATWDATGAVWTFETANTGDLLNNVDENTSGDNGVYKFNGSTWVLQTSVTTGAYWVIGGNSGYTNPKLGTIDNKGLRFIAHNKQWLTVASNKTITWNDFTGVGAGFLKVSAAGVMSRDNSVYITGNQMITLSGDVTGSGTTTISTTIASHAVSNAKFRQSAGLSVVGNSTNSTADVADITGTDGQVLRVSGTSLGFGSVLASSISSGANLSVTSGTNVTLTISSGTGTGALLTAAGITAGWIGQLSVDKGGTGLAAVTAHYLLVGNGTSALTLLAPSATSGIPLISQGSSSDPAYGTAVVAGGGTGNTTFTAYSVITAGTTATGAFQNVSGVGTSGQVLTSNGPSAFPTWQTASSGAVSSVSDDGSGTLTISPTTGAVLAGIALGHANTWTAKQTIQLATEQLALGYDASNHVDFVVGSTGTTTVTLTGTSPIFNINNNTTVTGQTALSNGVSQNLLVGSTSSTGFQYRTTNGGSNTNSNTFFDLASAKTTAGNISVAMDASATNGALMFLQGNGSRAIRGAYITPSGLTSTAGSEVMGLDFGTQTGGTTATVKMTLTGAGSLGIGTISPNALLNVEKDNISTTVTNGLIIENTQAAISGTQQYSPALSLIGRGWTTASGGSSVASEFRIYTKEVQANPQTVTLSFDSYSGGSSRNVGAMTIVDDGATNVKVNAANFTATVNMITPTINGSGDLNVTSTMKLFTAARDVVISPVTLTDNGYRLAIIGSESITGGFSVSTATTPSTTSVTISHTGAAGSTSYTYKYIGVTADGSYSDVSAAITTSDGNATLDGTHTNNILLGNRNWTEGYTSLRVYRTASSGTPSSTGFIGTAAITGGSMSTFIDGGLAGDGTVPQTYNSTGVISANKLKITAGGGNANIGTATLSGGTVTVSTTAVTASSIIFLTDATTGALTNVGSPTVGTKTAGVSFVINSTNVLDASTVNWIIIN